MIFVNNFICFCILQLALPLMPAQAMTQQVNSYYLCAHINLHIYIFYYKFMKDVFSFALSLSLLQATRHARRVYVGGLPPLANEQVIFLVLRLDSIPSTSKGFNSIVDIWSRLKFDAFCVITLESKDVLCI